MTKWWLALALAAAGLMAGIPQPEYRARRAQLQRNLDGTLILFGYQEGPDEVYRPVQDTNLLYLTGWEQPGAVLVLTPRSETLFVPPRNERKERYHGRRAAPGDADAAQVTGVTRVLGLEKLESVLRESAGEWVPVYAPLLHPRTAALRAMFPLREFRESSPLVAKLRMKKSAAELAEIQRATDVSMEAHLASWRKLQAGAHEYNAVASFTQVVLDRGCEKHAYEPIFGSGPNSVILHYHANQRRMDRGEMVVIDAAASCGGYASDITRSVPVGGKFSERQKAVYQVVLGALEAALKAVKPGVMLSGGEQSLTGIAKKYMDDHGGYGKYFIHGIGHHVGLDVHDASLPVPLEEGAVITLEPGIYIPEENLGIRIEDIVLVTANGARVLSAALPKEWAEVEKAMAR
jgi:Xaa-Pro aminopeptidase